MVKGSQLMLPRERRGESGLISSGKEQDDRVATLYT